MQSFKFTSVLIFFLMLGGIARAQQIQAGAKPLSNQDVISMAKNLLPESVITGAINTNDESFDVSPNGLIALKKAGVSTKVMEAMLAAVNKKNSAKAPAPAAPAADATTAANAVADASSPTVSATGATPTVLSTQGNTKINLAAEATQIVQTKAKANSLSALAADQALNEALNLGTQAIQQAVMKSGSMMGNSAVSSGSNVLSNLLSHRPKQSKVTYVWALSGGSPSPASDGNTPMFDVNYGGIPGVNADQFEPVIVKLAPTPQSNFRLVGATEASTTAEQSAQQDWPIYSSFTEDRVAAKVQKLGTGHAQITPSAAMGAGDYAIALRPVDKSKKFSGEDVGRNQGEGLLFNYAWPFSVK